MTKRITMVSYINTLPFLYGLQQSPIAGEIDLRLDHPAACAAAFLARETDIALIPAAVLHKVPEAKIISPFCIGTNGPVFSVGIFSSVPLENAEHLWLDYQSRTSVLLTRLLLKSYWKLDIPLKQAYPGYLKNLPENDATLIIGDRAIVNRNRFPYMYDLGEIWKLWTGLPFTFAVWVAHTEPDQDFLAAFNEALRTGLNMRNEIAVSEQVKYPHFSLHDYLHVSLDYQLDAEKQQALNLFLSKTEEMAKAEMVFV